MVALLIQANDPTLEIAREFTFHNWNDVLISALSFDGIHITSDDIKKHWALSAATFRGVSNVTLKASLIRGPVGPEIDRLRESLPTLIRDTFITLKDAVIEVLTTRELGIRLVGPEMPAPADLAVGEIVKGKYIANSDMLEDTGNGIIEGREYKVIVIEKTSRGVFESPFFKGGVYVGRVPDIYSKFAVPYSHFGYYFSRKLSPQEIIAHVAGTIASS